MELTWLFATSVLLFGGGYVFLQRAPRPRFVGWTLLGASLFALATRDLFRSRQQGRPKVSSRESPGRDDDRRRTPLFARLQRRVAGWLD